MLFDDEYTNSMGSVVFTDKKANMKLYVKGVKGKMKVVWVVNGKNAKEETFTGKMWFFMGILTVNTVIFARAQMYRVER